MNKKSKYQKTQIQMITIFKKLSRDDKSIIGNTLYHKPFKSQKIYNRQKMKKIRLELEL